MLLDKGEGTGLRPASAKSPRRLASTVEGAPRWQALIAIFTGMLVLATPLAARQQSLEPIMMIAPIMHGEETIIVTQHRITTPAGPVAYEARVGRLPIRSEDTGEIRAYMFFVAYHRKDRSANRPITFLWNGGPTSPSWILHTLGFGPRLRRDGAMVDNPETLLRDSDLVFMDPIGTGFSRPAKPEFAAEFLQFQGDVAATVEFIRAYRTRFRALKQPLLIAGESYGVIRGAAVLDVLTRKHVEVAGAILISGSIPNIPAPIEFYNAMHIPARTAGAFYHKRLAPELMRDRTETMTEAARWARETYQPALARVDHLDDSEREDLARDLARYTGISPDMVDRRTLVVPTGVYLSSLLGVDQSHKLGYEDLRFVASKDRGSPDLLDAYLRGELGYATELVYRPVEKGYMPTPGPLALPTSKTFYFNQAPDSEEAWHAFDDTGEIAPLLRSNPTWIIDALTRAKTMRVMVLTGRYDATNMCEGSEIMTETLPADLSNRISNHCYEGGHIIYKDEAARLAIAQDVAVFVRQATAR